MIRKILSRYSILYPRALVYMLQASEYDIRDYLDWYQETSDFNNVEKRKHLVKTVKANLLLISCWLILLAIYSAAILVLWFSPSNFKYIGFIAIIVVSPYILAYAVVLPLLLIKVLQLPVEAVILNRAQEKLKKHSALKIAIAGSFGKTSMREILKTVLSEGKKVSAPPHSYNTPLGIARFVDTLKGDEEVIIFELGEYYPGDVFKLAKLTQPDMGVITGVNEAHLHKFKSLEITAKTIFELADYLGDRVVYVNGESDIARNKARETHLIYNRDGLKNWKTSNLQSDLEGTSFSLTDGDILLDLKSKLLGLHQVGPLVVAVNIASQIGLSPGQIKVGIAKTKPFEHRLNPNRDSAGVITIDDSYNGNPDGVRAVIEFLASLSGHRRLYVTPGLVEIGSQTEGVHKEIGRQLAKSGIEKVVLIKNSVTKYIEQGLKEGNYSGEIIWFDNALSAFAALSHLTVAGDVVLLQNDWPDQYR